MKGIEMSESIIFEAQSEDSIDESDSHNDAIAAVAVTGLALAASAIVVFAVKKHFENKAEEELWNEPTSHLNQ